MKEALEKAIQTALKSLDIADPIFKLEYPENNEHGDFSCNAAMVYAKHLKVAPKALAEKIVEAFGKVSPGFIQSVSVAGPGFINFKIKEQIFAQEIVNIVAGGAEYGWGKTDADKKVMVEYTDPNPFKIFHIGHLMANAIGESLSRLIESQAATVKRANWQGDVGLHVAKTIWGVIAGGMPAFEAIGQADLVTRVQFLGSAYVAGNTAFEDPASKKQIDEINKKVFDRSDSQVNDIYDNGRQWSLDYFETIYTKLGTKFDYYFFEGKEGLLGRAVVEAFLDKGVFEKSEGAIVFKGEKYGLHTRVFITSNGLPTYETKELGLNAEKFKVCPDLSESIIVTANEQNDYFKVLLKVMSLVYPEIAAKTRHLSHGILRFASGKMSSRKGNIISAENLLVDIKALVTEKIAERELTAEEKEDISNTVAIGAIKYSILRQAVGSDVIFDSSASISFEGDSGPYLQYAAVRAGAVLEKAKKLAVGKVILPEQVTLLEKLISRFPAIVAYARADYGPQHIANYLIALAGAFNSYYASNQIINETDPLTPYRLALTQAFLTTMTNGLWLLGIKVPKKM